MKLKSVLNLVVVLIVGQLLFACNPARYYEFAGHKQEPYHHLKQKPAPEAAPSLSEIALAAAEEKAEEEAATPVLEANAATVPVVVKLKAVMPKLSAAETVEAGATVAKNTITEAEALAMVKEKVASMTKAEKKELKKELKESLRQKNAGRTSVVEVILAFLLPPLAVFLHSGIGTEFWISLLLTLLFWIPGVIYALLVVTDTI